MTKLTDSIYNRPDIYDIHFSGKMSDLLKQHYEIVLKDKGIKTIHDCSYGTGNLTNELYKMGYTVSGSDISYEMLERAKIKNTEENLDIKTTQSDFRFLTDHIKGSFDCVMSTGNSLAHVSNEDVSQALKQMASLVIDGGYIYIDTRNWDQILKYKQRFYHYQPMFKNDERINAMQVWDYNADGTMLFNLLYSFEKDNKIYKREAFTEKYYPLLKDFLIAELKKHGFDGFELYNFIHHDVKVFEDMEWYVIMAKKKTNL